jgi:hypothetical protein
VVAVDDVAGLLTSAGACLMDAAEVTACLGADDDAWAEISSHWEQLAPAGLL